MSWDVGRFRVRKPNFERTYKGGMDAASFIPFSKPIESSFMPLEYFGTAAAR